MNLNLLSVRLILTLIYLFTAAFIMAEPLVAKEGMLDLRHSNLNENRVALTGNWYYFENQLLTSRDIYRSGEGFSWFPKTWNELRASRDGSGYATYALYVLVSPTEKSLAIEIPQIYCSYKLWVNDHLLAVNGQTGKSAQETIPQWLPQTVAFENPGDTLKLVLQISNFQHHLGGSKDPLYLGSSALLLGRRSLAVTSNLVESATLAFLGVCFLLVYLFMKTKRVTLFFALLCLTWALRVGFSNLYIFISYLPDFDWYTMIRIEYVTLFLTMIWAILFLCRVFPKEENKIFKYLLVIINGFFIAYTLLVPPASFTAWITIYLSCCGVLMAYGVILVLRAWINQRTGSTYLTISFLLGILIFGYDVFSYEGMFVYNPIILSIGYVVIFLLMGVVLLLHLKIIKSNQKSLSMLTYNDLYKDA